MLLMRDAASERLYTVASLGYDASGVGSEIALGQGVAGIAAREGVAIRVGHLSLEDLRPRRARRARRRSAWARVARRGDPDARPGRAAQPAGRAAEAVRRSRRACCCVESSQDQHFSYDDEDALAVLANQLALQLHVLQRNEAEVPAADAGAAAGARRAPPGEALLVRHHPHNDSVFIGNDYLIKGVAGAIFRKLVADHLAQGRTEFSNRELRLDASLKLPEVTDNLDVRLILLQRRLEERGGPVRIEKTGRGRFRLVLERPLRLETMTA